MGLTQQYDIAGIDFRENDQRNFQKFKSPPKIFEDMRGTPTIFHLFWRRIRYFEKISISFYTIFEILMVLQSFGFPMEFYWYFSDSGYSDDQRFRDTELEIFWV